MKPSQLVAASLLGFGVYLVLELLFGQYGIVAYNSLERFRVKTVAELEQLYNQSAEFQQQVRLLTTDSETIRLEARDIGLVGSEDVVVRIANREPRSRHQYYPGTVPQPIPRVRDNRPLFRSMGLTVFLVILLIDLLGVRRNRTRHRSTADDADDADDAEG